jgi:hypothetical protein
MVGGAVASGRGVGQGDALVVGVDGGDVSAASGEAIVWLVGAGVGGGLVEQGKVVCHLDLFMPLNL